MARRSAYDGGFFGVEMAFRVKVIDRAAMEFLGVLAAGVAEASSWVAVLDSRLDWAGPEGVPLAGVPGSAAAAVALSSPVPSARLNGTGVPRWPASRTRLTELGVSGKTKWPAFPLGDGSALPFECNVARRLFHA